MSCSREHAAAFLSQGGMRATPDHDSQSGVDLLQRVMNDIESRIGSFWDIFAKAKKIYDIWSRPGWTVADLEAKVNETYALFSLTPPVPTIQ